jgi:hypothetical protein
MSFHPYFPDRETALIRRPDAGHADILDAWLGAHPRANVRADAAKAGSTADWNAPSCPVKLAYDTADQGLPSGVRALLQEGSRRLMFEAREYEIVLRVASDRRTQQYELAGQVLYEGLPLPGATVQVDQRDLGTTTLTDLAGGFRLPPLDHGAFRLKVAVEGAVLTVPPIALS